MAGYTLDWKKYVALAVETAAEGCVLLENRGQALPIREGETCAVFGRIQSYYYKSGTGSGGMVNTNYVHGILDGLKAESSIHVDEELVSVYQEWEKINPIEKGKGWGQEPWSQEEMPLTDELVEACAKRDQVAVVLIGRTAGEDQDNRAGAGSYCLSDGELAMIEVVCRHFERTAVVLNVGNIIDMSWVKKYQPAAVLYAWQGGMEGGIGTAKVLTGEITPSGKLPDTIAKTLSDYPSDANFYEGDDLVYQEDIYVGYRYFETAAKDRVVYPFGYGLSYTAFSVNSSLEEKTVGTDESAASGAAVCETGTADTVKSGLGELVIRSCVKNTGSCAGKEVVQVYVQAPQGKLGQPLRRLVAFEKTKNLQPGEEETLVMSVEKEALASYDDSGVTGNPYCYVLEAGTYVIYAGTDVRSCEPVGEYVVEETIVTERCSQRMAPGHSFTRMKPVVKADGTVQMTEEPVPVRGAQEEAKLPDCLPYTGDMGWKLKDVYEKTVSLDAFIAQLSDKELCEIVRGEGMSSPRVTPGTAAAFGGVSDGLTGFGIPAACCTDGPSGMRLDSGTNAFSLPNGTLLACTFNRQLVADLYEMEGLEMRNNRIDTLLGPGMNIHRHPLNGRNFEYFSEDPYLSGQIAAAQLQGMARVGVTGTIKHFCANNREFRRRFVNSIVSERALREIYLKGFEIAVKEGGAYSIMTTYGAVNGLWTAGLYDQNTAILRDEWGYDGIVMTDWWAEINNREGEEATRENLAMMVKSQNDVYMVTRSASENVDDLETALAEGRLTRGELARCAANTLRFILRSPVMERQIGQEQKVEIINAPADQKLTTDFSVQYHRVVGPTEISLSDVPHEAGDSHILGVSTRVMGNMRISLTAASDFDDLAQMSVSVFVDNTIFGTYTFHGSNGEPVTISRENNIFGYNHYVKLYFAQSGLTPISMKVEMLEDKMM
ncbi:MAG: glycoside hydrolase family 3 protein [Lachnospiraceae bacterium]|nr:glycoside hydrolase family 3 protein [Lachnospiraceae bacterium]